MDKNDLVEVMLQLLGPQRQSLNFNELAGLVALIDLLGILSLLNNKVPVPARGSNAIQEALSAVLGQSGGRGQKSPADIISLLGKNPALVAGLMNLLTGSKDNKEQEKEETGSAGLEEKTPQHQPRSNRFRGS